MIKQRVRGLLSSIDYFFVPNYDLAIADKKVIPYRYVFRIYKSGVIDIREETWNYLNEFDSKIALSCLIEHMQ